MDLAAKIRNIFQTPVSLPRFFCLDADKSLKYRVDGVNVNVFVGTGKRCVWAKVSVSLARGKVKIPSGFDKIPSGFVKIASGFDKITSGFNTFSGYMPQTTRSQ